MKEIFIVDPHNVAKAESLLKTDEIVNRGSITIRQCSTLGIDKNGFFIIIDCNDIGIERAKELLKDIAQKADEYKLRVLEALEKENESIGEGFGLMMG